MITVHIITPNREYVGRLESEKELACIETEFLLLKDACKVIYSRNKGGRMLTHVVSFQGKKQESDGHIRLARRAIDAYVILDERGDFFTVYEAEISVLVQPTAEDVANSKVFPISRN